MVFLMLATVVPNEETMVVDYESYKTKGGFILSKGDIHLRFEWNPNKNESNIKKHGVDFIEAETVFQDEMALELFDGRHSDDEDR